MNPESPLGQEHLSCIDRGLERCARLAKLFDLCKECDLDIEEPLAEFERQLTRLTKLKGTFFPDHV
jgi:hypothetical protein